MYVYATKTGLKKSSVPIPGLKPVKVDWTGLPEEVQRWPKFNGTTIVLDAAAKAAAATAASTVQLAAVRSKRNDLLQASDWTVLPDAQLTDAEKAEALAYRQALRDLPGSTPDPTNPVWPQRPEFIHES